MSKDYVFKINWKDRHKDLHDIGVLAQLNNEFYLVVKSEDNAKKAYEMGFRGIPGFKTDEVYKSNELFDFFQNRVLKGPNVNFCEELEKTGGISMIDSFSVEKMPYRSVEKYKKMIKEIYGLQEAFKNVKKEKKLAMSR